MNNRISIRRVPRFSFAVFTLLFSSACGFLCVGLESTATPDPVASGSIADRATEEAIAATRVSASETPARSNADPVMTPTGVLDGSHLTFNDPVLGLSLDIPLWWESQTTPGAVARFLQLDHVGARLTVMTISALSPESTSLELGLEEVIQGAWGPYISAVQSVFLGTFDALRLEMIHGADRPPVMWLVVAPCGRAIGIIPGGDPAWIEPMIEVVLETLRPLTPLSRPTTIPEARPTPAVGITDLQEPLLIEGEQGWIFASAHLDGDPKTVKLATQDGRLLAAFEAVGRLALDRVGNRLIVDQGEAGIAILDAQSGVPRARITLPTAGPATVDPQVDPTSGLVYIFRDKTVYVIDPATMTVTQAMTLGIPSTVCDDPRGDAPIARSYYDLVNRKLYLTFVTRVCTPWVQETIVAYDAATLTELGRYAVGGNHQAVPFSDSLYGSTASPIGRNAAWAWNGSEAWFQEGDEGRHLQGIAADWGRQLVYEALGGQIWVLTPYPRKLFKRIDVTALANGGRLVGHDPISDQLYFLVNGHLQIRATSTLLSLPSRQEDTPAPYCRPSDASVILSAATTTLQVGQEVPVTMTLNNGATSGARLGRIQYSLVVQPADLFSPIDLRPIAHAVSLEPGQSDKARFVLRATAPGGATLAGATDYEIHAMDYSWGSESGCRSWPLELTVTP